MMIINRAITIVCLAGAVVATLLAVLYGSPFFAFLSAFMFVCALLLWKYGYIFVPVLTKMGNIVEVRGDYEVPSSRDVIIKKTSDGYYATKFLEIKYYESSIDKDEASKTTIIEAFEKSLSSLKYVVKISLLISSIDLSKHIDDIKTKRSVAEAKRARGMDESEKIRLEREIAMWNRLLDRLTSGERPLELIAYASTTAFGLTKEEALAKARRQAKEVKTILSSTLGADVTDLYDLDMLRCFEWDYFFPTSEEELRDEVF